MDTPTQAVLGAAVGQALFGHRLGRRAAVWGAVGGLIPDLDMLAALATGAWGEFVLHRGPSHSLLFAPLVGPLLGHAVWRFHARRRTAEPDPGDPGLRGTWMWLFTAALFTHPLLDWFTTYGTQLLWPITNHRFALNGVAIIDPLYTLPMLAGLALACTIRRGYHRGFAALALAITTAYLGIGWGLNVAAEAEAGRQLAAEGVSVTRVRAYPTLFQPLLRRTVARAPDAIRVGTYTFLNPGPIRWSRFVPSRDPLVGQVLDTDLGRVFRWFAMNQLAPHVRESPHGFTVEIDDVRYGYPGAPARQGIWGIRRSFDRERRPTGPVERFRRPLPAPAGEMLRSFWMHLRGATEPDAQARARTFSIVDEQGGR